MSTKYQNNDFWLEIYLSAGRFISSTTDWLTLATEGKNQRWAKLVITVSYLQVFGYFLFPPSALNCDIILIHVKYGS